MFYPRWKRVWPVILVCGLIALPLLIFFLRKPQVATLLPWSVRRASDTSHRYIVQSDVTGYELALADPSYLDYVTADFNIFARDAIVDPEFYRGNRNGRRLSIASIRFVLVDYVDRPLSTISNGDGQSLPMTLVAEGDYLVEGETLVVRNALRFDALGSGALVKKFAWEDAFLRSSVSTLYYALGKTSPEEDRKAFGRIRQDIDKNLYPGLFPWPFRITQQNI